MIARLRVLACWLIRGLLVLPSTAMAVDELAGIDPYIEAAMSKWGVPALSIAVVKDGQIVHARGYGLRQVGTELRTTEHTVFRLASITKTFTAATVGLLVEDGKLAWDDPVKKQVPSFELHEPYLTENVTLRDLLSHRVGLETGDILARRGDLPREEILRRLKFLQPYAPFRGRFKYSNLMYVAAGEAVERAGGLPWEDVVAQRLLAPLGMKATSPNFARLQTGNVATAYRLHDGRLQAVTTAPQIDAVASAGSMHSTAADMAQWLKFWLAEGQAGERRLLQQATIREMLAMHSATPVVRRDNRNVYAARFFGWGLGWSVLDYRGRKLHTHTGGSGTFIGLAPEANVGVVVLTNLEFSNLAGMLFYDVLDAYWLAEEHRWTQRNWPTWLAADEPPEITGDKARARRALTRRAGTKPAVAISALAGRYRCDLYGDLELRASGQHLELVLGSNSAVRLEHWQDNSFVSPSPEADAPWFDWLIEFQVPAGTPEALTVERLGWDEPMPKFIRVANAP
jgi:CubicO group peptidase (beta-lactamase class C family)